MIVGARAMLNGTLKPLCLFLNGPRDVTSHQVTRIQIISRAFNGPPRTRRWYMELGRRRKTNSTITIMCIGKKKWDKAAYSRHMWGAVETCANAMHAALDRVALATPPSAASHLCRSGSIASPSPVIRTAAENLFRFIPLLPSPGYIATTR